MTSYLYFSIDFTSSIFSKMDLVQKFIMFRIFFSNFSLFICTFFSNFCNSFFQIPQPATVIQENRKNRAELAEPEPDEFQDEIQFDPTTSSGQLEFFGDFWNTQNPTAHWKKLDQNESGPKVFHVQDWRNLLIFLKLRCKIDTMILIYIFQIFLFFFSYHNKQP